LHLLRTPPEEQSEAAERIALTGRAVWGEPDARMGQGALLA
jgi:hypothetical protein